MLTSHLNKDHTMGSKTLQCCVVLTVFLLVLRQVNPKGKKIVNKIAGGVWMRHAKVRAVVCMYLGASLP